MSQTDDKPYTRYHSSRVRRARPEPLDDRPRDAGDGRRSGRVDDGNGGRGDRAGVGDDGRGERPDVALYRGGRRGQAATARRPERSAEPEPVWRDDRRPRGDRPDLALVPATARKRKLFHWWYLLAVPLALAIAFGVWAYLGYKAFDKAVAHSNRDVGSHIRSALLDPTSGVLGKPTTVLVLGSDQRGHQPARSDTIMLMRFDPSSHSLSELSIPRDTLVTVPGHGQTKINEAYFWGGAPLAIKVVQAYTGVPINHVMMVNFHGFPKLIDSVGGVVVDVPHDITSWYPGNRTVHFKKGPQLMMGQQALIYSRLRHVDNDFMRMGRQQQVVQALETKITRPRNFLDLPWTGARFMQGVTTDLRTDQILGLAYLDWRARGHQYKSVVIGTPQMIGGVDYVVVSRSVLRRDVAAFLSH
jgi:LCP family protein required for cell wall assembly